MTPRQFYLIVFIFSVSTKMQRLPCLLFEEFGKDGYIIFLLYFVIELLLIFVAFFITKYFNQEQFNKSQNSFFSFVKKLIMLATSLYFMIDALMLYEHIQDLFANTLFDNLSWPIFSLLLLFTVFYLAKSGIKNVAFNYELYSYIIIVSLILISILGVSHSNYAYILPFETIDFGKLIAGASKYNIWFGDSFLILYMIFHTKSAKLSKTLLSYVLSMVFILFLTITFYGLYQLYTPLQSGMVSNITELSMLGINVGRVDWFLILLAEVGTILSCSVCIYFSQKSLDAVFPKIKPIVLYVIIAGLFYYADIFVLRDKFFKREFFFGIGGTVALCLKLLTIVLLLLISLKDKKKYLKSKKLKMEADYD